MPPSDLKREYLEYDRGVRLSNVRIASILVITLMPFGCILDCFVYPQYLGVFLGLRLVTSLLTAIAWLLLESKWQKTVYPFLIHAWYLLPTIAISLMIAHSEGAVSPYYAGLILVILAVSAVMQTSLTESIIPIAAIFGIYFGACILHGSLGKMSAVFGNLYFLIVTAFIVLAGNFNFNRLRYREFVLRHEWCESQRQLEVSNLQLRELDEAKSRFFANISHEDAGLNLLSCFFMVYHHGGQFAASTQGDLHYTITLPLNPSDIVLGSEKEQFLNKVFATESAWEKLLIS